MNRQEVIALTVYTQSHFPNMPISPQTVDAWHDVLAPFSLADARAAVIAHVQAGSKFISIGEIYQGITRIRNDRIEAAPPYTGLGGDPTTEIQAIRRRNTAIASGAKLPQPAAITSGTTEAFDRTAKGIRMLREAAGLATSRGIQYDIPCPHCRAPSRKRCTTPRGRFIADAHPSRWDAARRYSAGLGIARPDDLEREVESRRAASAASLTANPQEPV
jgi:hypothetical protein